MIRKATHDDVSMVVDMGSEFHDYSPWRSVPFDRDATSAFVVNLIDHGVVFVSDGGMIGGLMNPLYFNPAFAVGCELFWWAKFDGRKLMKAFEEWAQENGARGVQFSSLGDEQSERMAVLFDRAGYSKVETGWFKEI